MADVEIQKPRSLSLAAFCALLIDRGLTSDPTTQTMVEPAARRASSSREEKNTNTILIKSKSAKKELPFELEEHSEQIAEFMNAKKGSKGPTAWNLLLGELEKIRAKYGSAVVAEQLQLAINGKWQGVQLSNYERYATPNGATAAQRYGGQKSIAELSEEMRAMPSLDQLLGRS
jgi:hypothetical protein